MKNSLLSFFTSKTILVFLLVVSVVCNVFLSRKIERLNRAVYVAESVQNLTAGTVVPALEVKDLSGKDIRINYSDDRRPTIIYVFTPQCMWCTRNLENIKLLSNNLNESYRVIGISLTSEDLSGYLAKNQFTFPIYIEPSTATKTNFKLGATPKTIVVSVEGKILKTWSGAYMGDLKSEIEEFFHLELPGFKEERASKN